MYGLVAMGLTLIFGVLDIVNFAHGAFLAVALYVTVEMTGRFGVHPYLALLVAVPVVVGSLGRIPVGALTDRLGARLMFPAISLLTIVPVLFVGLVAAKFALTFHRSTPDSRHALVLAESTADESAAARLLSRAHGKLGNTWREALVATTGATKRAAAEHVRTRAPRTDDLDLRLIDLPRHRLAAVVRTATERPNG